MSLDVAGGGLTFLAVALLFAPDGGYSLETGLETARWLAMVALACLSWPAAIGRLGLYDSQRRRSLSTVVGKLALAGVACTTVLTAGAYAFSIPVASAVPVVAGLAQCAVLSLTRILVHFGLRLLRRLGRNYRNVLVVGTGPRAAHVRRLMERHPEWGLRLVGYVDDTDEPLDPMIRSSEVHKLIEVPALLRDAVVDEVIIACPRSMLHSIGPVVGACASAGVPFTMLTDIFGDYLPPPRVTRFDSLAALSFAPVHHSRGKLAVKRAIDVVGAAVGLVLAGPVLACAAVAIRATSPGPVLFRQVRCGLNGRRFEILKLRTMCVDAEEKRESVLHLNEMDGPVFKAKDDPRVTPVGRFLRRHSLDEIPQLLNVLYGDMSLVGPRPPMPHEVAQYDTGERRRLSMRPGLTCLWQVSGRNDLGFEEWVELDLEYIDAWSLANDARILARTIPAILLGTGS